jgi:imidazolonepropionase-like amidohydrolase
MSKKIAMLLALSVIALPGPSAGTEAQETPADVPPRPLVLEHAAIFDGRTGQFRPGRTLVIAEGLIVDEYASGQKPIPDGARTLDLGGKFVIPGLIDSHVHIASDPSGFDRRDSVEKTLLKALRGGVTFVRDMAGDGRALADLNRAIVAGDILAPGLRFAALMAGPGFFSDPKTIMSSKGETSGHTPWGRAVTDSTDLVLAVAEGHGTGASAIKVYREVEPALLARIVTEAHRQGLAVWSHATIYPSKPLDAVKAGVDVISHADQIIWEAMPGFNPNPADRQGYLSLLKRLREQAGSTVSADHPAVISLLELMRERGTVLDATVCFLKDSVAASEKKYPQLLPLAKARADFAYAVTRMAHEMGVEVSAGTDGLFDDDDPPWPAIHLEMATLVEECGFTPAEALRAATEISARALGIANTHGSIEPGRAADLVVLRADPTADIHNTLAIELVIKSGRIVPAEDQGH